MSVSVRPDAAPYSRPYADAALIYRQAGWSGVLPLPRRMKETPPLQFTGGNDIDPTIDQINAWRTAKSSGNICLRMATDTVGIDVDAYGAKRGDKTLAELEARLGPLPATWRSSSRGAGPTGAAGLGGLAPSGIYIFRIPSGSYFKGVAGPSIEIIQRTHRYIVCWPSTNPDNHGEQYRWYRPDGTLADESEVPRAEDLPDLPEAWVDYLSSGTERAKKADTSRSETSEWIAALRRGRPCGKVLNTLDRARASLADDSASAHDTAMRYVRALVMLGAEGHQLGDTAMTAHGRGAAIDALYHLQKAFVANVTNPARGKVRTDNQAEDEFLRLYAGAVKLAMHAIPEPRQEDPECIEQIDNQWPEWIGQTAPAGIGVSPHDVTADGWPSADVVIDDEGHPGTSRRRQPLNVTNAAVVAEWLKITIGTGALSGCYLGANGTNVVYTPRVGEAGYVAPKSDGDSDGPAQVREVTSSVLMALVQYSFAPYRQRDAKDKDPGETVTTLDDGQKVVQSPATIPPISCQIALALPSMLDNLKPLRGVVHAPTVRPDGSVIGRPGYDGATRLLYLPEPGLRIPAVSDRPSAEDIDGARKLILDMIRDFPFVTDHDRAAYLGALLTPLLRLITPPPYKLFIVSAHQAGSGKTLLAQLALAIHGGVFRTELPDKDQEIHSSVTAILAATTAPIVLYDNATGLIRSPILAGLLTSRQWDAREFGKNTSMLQLTNDRLWMMTGNNAAVGGDLARRTVWINIDPGRPDPQLRQGFAIPDIEGWVTAHRGDLLAALLTLVRAWVAAGSPSQRRSSDAYGAWLAALNGILTTAGIPGVVDEPTARPRAEGDEDAEWGTFLRAIHASFGAERWTPKEVLGRLDTGTLDGDVPRGVTVIPSDALPEGLAIKLAQLRSGPLSLARSLGRWLTNRQGRWAGNLTVRKVFEARLSTYWCIEAYAPTTQSTLPDVTSE